MSSPVLRGCLTISWERILAGFSEEQVVAETMAVYRDELAEAGL